MWRTTSRCRSWCPPRPISIHVLHVEDDDFYRVIGFGAVNFNPRPPCGGRRIQRQDRQGHYDFNPRPPCGGRHLTSRAQTNCTKFQSTSSMWRTTFGRGPGQGRAHHFNPRPPCGGRPPRRTFPAATGYFNPRPPCGGRPVPSVTPKMAFKFQSTSSMWRTTTRQTAP